MDFKEKYTSATDKELGKKIISDDAYAIGEMISELIKKLEDARAAVFMK